MFRHRKRLIAKRLSILMRKKNQIHMRDMFRKFVQRKSAELSQAIIQPQIQQHQQQDIVQQQISQQSIDFQDGYVQQDQFQQQEQTQQLKLSDYIAALSPEEKRMFKRENPQLPETFFMNRKQKQKYFARKNSKFQKDLAHTPERHSKNKKHVQFKQKYQDRVSQIKKAKEKSSPYNNQIHFS